MKFPGHNFGVMIGLVDQETYLPVGSMFNFRVQSAETRRVAKKFEDTNNFSGGATSGVTTNRTLTVTLNDFYDDLSNFVDTPLVMEEGWYFRLAIGPFASTGVLDQSLIALCFLAPVVHLGEGDWNPNSLEGQPTKLTFETVRDWHNPGSARAAALAIRSDWTW